MVPLRIPTLLVSIKLKRGPQSHTPMAGTANLRILATEGVGIFSIGLSPTTSEAGKISGIFATLGVSTSVVLIPPSKRTCCFDRDSSARSTASDDTARIALTVSFISSSGVAASSAPRSKKAVVSLAKLLSNCKVRVDGGVGSDVSKSSFETRLSSRLPRKISVPKSAVLSSVIPLFGATEFSKLSDGSSAPNSSRRVDLTRLFLQEALYVWRRAA